MIYGDVNESNRVSLLRYRVGARIGGRVEVGNITVVARLNYGRLKGDKQGNWCDTVLDTSVV